MKTTTLNAILVGLIIVLVGMLLVQDSRSNVAAARDNAAATTMGVGVGTNGVIAVTGQYSQNNSVLYLIDTKREVILTYACYSRGRGTAASQFNQPILDFLNGRTYSWDAIFCQTGNVGRTEGPTPSQIKQAIEKKQED